MIEKMHTLEQVRAQLEVTKQRIEENRAEWKQYKIDFATAKNAGDKEKMKEITAKMDVLERVRVGHKTDMYALMAEEKSILSQEESV